jgi:hypothetical protein
VSGRESKNLEVVHISLCFSASNFTRLILDSIIIIGSGFVTLYLRFAFYF